LPNITPVGRFKPKKKNKWRRKCFLSLSIRSITEVMHGICKTRVRFVPSHIGKASLPPITLKSSEYQCVPKKKAHSTNGPIRRHLVGKVKEGELPAGRKWTDR